MKDYLNLLANWVMNINGIAPVSDCVWKLPRIFNIGLRKNVIADKTPAFAFARFWAYPNQFPIFRFFLVCLVFDVIPGGVEMFQNRFINLVFILNGIKLPARLSMPEKTELCVGMP